MGTIVRTFRLENGDAVLVEAHNVAGDREVTDIAKLEDAAGTFEKAWSQLQPAMNRVVEQLRELGPDKVEVKFGVKLSGNFNALLAGSSAEGNFEVVLGWTRAK